MKKLLNVLDIAGGTSSRRVEKTVKKFWWNIEETCFTGTSIDRRNGMFMSTAHNIPVGAIYKIRKDITGRVKKVSLDFTYKSVREELNCFPDKVENASTKPPCSFDLRSSSDYQLEITASLTDQSNIGKINAELQNILRNATALNLSITSWGFDILEQGKVEHCLSDNNNNHLVTKLREGDRYIALTAIWIEGIELKYDLDNLTATKVKAIYESNKVAFLNAGVNMNYESTTVLTTSLKYQERFYPFCRFGRITKKGEIKGIVDLVIEEPDFSVENNE